MQETVDNYQTRKTVPSKQALSLCHGLVIHCLLGNYELPFLHYGRKYHAFSHELMLFCFYASDETVRAFQFACAVISINLEYPW